VANSILIPRKPHPDFPLTPRGDGRWCKKIRGKLHYFTGTDDEALSEWLRVKDDLLAGRTPHPKDDERLTLALLCNRFLTDKKARIASGELDPKTWADYYRGCEHAIAVLGKTAVVSELSPDDFARLREKLAVGRGPVGLKNEIGRIRVAFNWAFENELLDRPARFGKSFDKPARPVLQRAKQQAEQARGKKLFGRDEILMLLDAASVPMKAAILLGINCGMGNSDIARMPINALDLENRWLDYPRVKTAVERKAPLWKETVAALRAVIANRPKPKDPAHASLVFLTRNGVPWVRFTMIDATDTAPRKESLCNAVASEFERLLVKLSIKRRGVGFYSLRHTFRTVASSAKDEPAASHIMGHSARPDDMAAVYREEIPDERLQAVARHVHDWLYSTKATNGKKAR